MIEHEIYMNRCLQLAGLGKGKTSPNPMVGALLVYNHRIIGEGFHQQYGLPHAEVNCINSVKLEDRALIEKSTLYVSLEPCAHFGKTPPCTNLIIENKIPTVVIACKDSSKIVNGKGIQQLQSAGIHVTFGVLENEAINLNKRFFYFHEKQRPYIILKWAQTNNKKIAGDRFSRVLISNEYTNRLTHQWRMEEDAILVGTNTAIKDNPSLTTRNRIGKNPVRIVIDNHLKLSADLNLLDHSVKTIVFNQIKNSENGNLLYVKISSKNILNEILKNLYEQNIQSLIVEGGQKLLQSFIDQNLWDETRIITNEKMELEQGLDAPLLNSTKIVFSEKINTDRIDYYLAR